MPANTKAVAYRWFMAIDPEEQAVMFEWRPEGEFVSSMTHGMMALFFRDIEGGTEAVGPWQRHPASEQLGEMPWVVAQNLARGQGFHIEVALMEDDDAASS